MARLPALCRVFDAVLRAVLTVGVVTLTLERGKQSLWMAMTCPGSQVWIWFQGCLAPKTKPFDWCHGASPESAGQGWGSFPLSWDAFALSPLNWALFSLCLDVWIKQKRWVVGVGTQLGAKLEPAACLGSSGFSGKIYPGLLVSPLKGKGANVRRVPSLQHPDLALTDLNPRLPGGESSGIPTNHLDPHLHSIMMLSPTSEWKETLLTITKY